MTKGEDAHALFRKGFTCSASVFSAFAGDLGLDPDTAKKIACGFGGGISRTGNICGAVSGAVMVIGLKYGKATQGDDAATARTRTLVREFISEFTARNGSVNWTELLGWNLADPREYEQARASGLFKTRRSDLMRDAVAVLEKVIGKDERE